MWVAMLSALIARGAEKRLARLPGLQRTDVNYVSGSATVEHDGRKMTPKITDYEYFGVL